MLTIRFRKTAIQPVLAASLIFVSSPAFAAEDAQLESLVRNAKVIKSSFPLRVERSRSVQNAVIVTTLLDPRAKPNDCKIDAMLVARTLIEGDKSIEKVYYHLKRTMRDTAFDSIFVRVSDVKAFGSKAIDENTLLSELDVVHKGPNELAATSSGGGSAHDTATTDGSATAGDTATTDGAEAKTPLRQFIFRELGDRKYAVATAFGHRVLSYAWLCAGSNYLATVQKHGQQAPAAEQIFRQMESLSTSKNYLQAHRLGIRFQDALTQDTVSPNLFKGPRQIDYHQVHQHYYELLQRELGKETPPDGSYLIERTKPVIRLEELDKDNVDTAPLWAILREANAAYGRQDYKTMTDKIVDLSKIFSTKYPVSMQQ